MQRKLDDDETLPQRKRGGGRPRKLTDKQIERGTRILKLKKNRRLSNQQAYDLLRRELKLPGNFSDVTLWRWIVSKVSRI